uniref:Transcription initiation factor TFIID subunit 12 domain-containing protein n=1 Tax=Chromera velia CCMP2878 TaxID=1169474 RepID=A0A0G4HWY6_9ALVE|mmetsp:Transcript_56021/g.109663  ORF Transcript_56021/g.109663 Transcript_56021/m.109663 type:complete len:222 (+) Transcript_56021:141-806(+)|eukprot:Cvel_9167.t1-p1 / transcript=Cvel_9167.t1 / gene=Cvel_9167 / organism=Chromera_velia_CCMP2878 / gene_product=hypothetical protein / transcript_product=hypothetical protein / location=Cvel_scaffold522:16613-18681(+) / protein_length=221 / sequence_SO=supercontig / SO=protein_coding / is_pseudo=false
MPEKEKEEKKEGADPSPPSAISAEVVKEIYTSMCEAPNPEEAHRAADRIEAVSQMVADLMTDFVDYVTREAFRTAQHQTTHPDYPLGEPPEVTAQEVRQVLENEFGIDLPADLPGVNEPFPALPVALPPPPRASLTQQRSETARNSSGSAAAAAAAAAPGAGAGAVGPDSVVDVDDDPSNVDFQLPPQMGHAEEMQQQQQHGHGLMLRGMGSLAPLRPTGS